MKLSATKISDFKACRRLYFFRYIEEILPVQESNALKDGKGYHSKIEELYNEGSFSLTGDKTDAMAKAYRKYIYPKLKIKSVEDWFTKQLNDNHTLIGRLDGVAEDGIVVEHKTTSSDIDENYIHRLNWNEQILCYMLANGITEMYYTVCKKPTLRQRKDETSEEFVQRCFDWYAVDTDKKIALIKISRTKQELAEFEKYLIKLADEMQACESDMLYTNPTHCMAWGAPCPYQSICLNYDKNAHYVNFIKKEKKEIKNDLF